MRRRYVLYLLWLLLTFTGPIWMLVSGKADLKADYRTASRESAHLAPGIDTPEAVIQIYAARAFNWRGLFASHCWISVKPKNGKAYTVYQVVGWLAYRGLPSLSIAEDVPDRYWYNEKPNVILDIRGERAEALIPKIDEAARRYPYAGPYTVWPGPNSNTFPAYIGREVPELGLVLPADAVGKDYLPNHRFFDRTPSGTGYQLSFFGLAGFTAGRKEGLEINFLGLTYGIRLAPFKILLPGLG